MFKLIVGVLVFTFITLVVFINLDPNIVNTSTSTMISNSTNFITTTISGEVQKPGTYVIDNNATLEALIELAGGTTANADENAFHLTLAIKPGGQYYIAPTHDPSDVCGTTALVKVALNSANQENLMTLSNIGNSLATAIIDHRQSKGPFTYLEEIMEVRGIGQSTFTRIKNYITLL